ncbi:hypothetical protein BCR24_13800 [Enterococcus ureilyticus]|uniref:Cupin n=1 Tax=Enterococcus ureilyticus TaxID=1131292 RepID=A0A1E5HDQ6_9ENTE|nr:cupin domain-containing protein [Enterococcus ureilyticus]MBM7689967.1 putative RmlC-like cupin family protein [Enterococcus ureilyticus]OEG23064.1 hypothetical protein BCR24_13800 [Enterococcus ureilyticus]
MRKTEKKNPIIIDQTNAVSVTKENGTDVSYFLFDTFEVHTNVIPAGCVQDWHVHNKIEEIIVVNEGTLFLEWIESAIINKTVTTGEMIRMNNSIHRISNTSDTVAKCTIFRFVSPSEDQSEIIKTDKKIYSEEEIASLVQ